MVFRNAISFLLVLVRNLFVAEYSPWVVVVRLVVLCMRGLLQEEWLTLGAVGTLAHMHLLCRRACVDLDRHVDDLLRLGVGNLGVAFLKVQLLLLLSRLLMLVLVLQ